MSAQSLFSKKNIESQQPETRTGIMDELNLPPALISFVRKNSRSLQVGLISLVVLVLGWVFYDYYTNHQESNGASLLAAAMQTEATAERKQVLENVINEYSRTNAARWSRLEMAHLDYQEGRFEEAIVILEEILAKIPADNSLLPLVRLNLGQSYEEAGKFDQALTQYSMLKKSSGFTEEAHLGLGRIYGAQNEPAQALKEYEELLNFLGDEADPQLRAHVQALIISSGGEKTAPKPQPEENKE